MLTSKLNISTGTMHFILPKDMIIIMNLLVYFYYLSTNIFGSSTRILREPTVIFLPKRKKYHQGTKSR